MKIIGVATDPPPSERYKVWFRVLLREETLRLQPGWAYGQPIAARTGDASYGRPRQCHIPDAVSIGAKAMMEQAKWQTVSWPRGTKGRLSARFSALRVRVADGTPQRIRDMGAQQLPGEEVWLVDEHRSTGERKYFLSNLPQTPRRRSLQVPSRRAGICEQAHQQLREELGFDHFEGRSWIARTDTARCQ